MSYFTFPEYQVMMQERDSTDEIETTVELFSKEALQIFIKNRATDDYFNVKNKNQVHSFINNDYLDKDCFVIRSIHKVNLSDLTTEEMEEFQKIYKEEAEKRIDKNLKRKFEDENREQAEFEKCKAFYIKHKDKYEK